MVNFLNDFERIVDNLKANNISSDHLLIFDPVNGWTYNGEKYWNYFTIGHDNLVNIDFITNSITFKMYGQLDLGQYRIYVLEEFNE